MNQNNNISYSVYKEFGFILMYYLPKIYSLYKQKKITHTKSRLGTKSLFFFSDNHTEVDIHDETMFPEQTSCYSFHRPEFTYNDWEPPKLNDVYKNRDIVFNKPILTIHNKNTQEWNSGPYNYFPSNILSALFNILKTNYQIIYIRPYDNDNSITKDKNQNVIDIGDEEILKKHPEIIWIKDLFNNSYSSYNELQFKILANSDHHIAPAGDCVIPAYFGGELLIYSHPNCNSSNRGIWKTNSWLKELSGANITSFNDYDELLNYCKQWI